MLFPIQHSATLSIKKARRANFGLKTELPQISGSSHTLLPFYYMLPVFARPEACPSCYSVQFDAAGVICFSMSVDVAGAAKLIAAINADWRECAKTTARRNENTARPKRAKRPTGKQRTAVDIAKIAIHQKTWMMRLQHLVVHGLKK